MTAKKIILIIIPVLFCVMIVLPSIMVFHVVHDTSKRIQRGAIERIIASESPVYYDDGQTPIGVFFEKTHRRYVHYQEIPKIFIKALVAAEDADFFSHKGVAIKSIIRALISNIKAGKVVQGGSTLTQQTAKNIFKREKRTYTAKLKELIQSFLLEKEYNKEEILEMYVNQFFVTGYGKGLGIASKYFFGKEPADLNLVEAAFIAGSVKGPNWYNPFIKKTEADKRRAIAMARQRKNYVLTNMHKLKFITQEQYIAARDQQIPFREEKITYRLNVILDYVREQLGSGYFQSILKEQGIENVAASGIKIYTSINRDMQTATLQSLRTHLPLMDIALNGYARQAPPDGHGGLFRPGFNSIKTPLPFMAEIIHIRNTKDDRHMAVAWPGGGGIIDYNGLKPVGEAWLAWKKGRGAIFDKKQARLFLSSFHIKEKIPVVSMPAPRKDQDTRLVLSHIPELNGGLIVLQHGMIKAMAGGYLDRFFNRAVDAKRQMGSIFKPLVYAAALQLKWNSLDPLMNTRDLFEFENTFYLPSPDHEPKSDSVSMTWAGAKSENLATVWLLYHLTDRLNMSEFRQLMQLFGLDRNAEETYMEYKKRIRDQHGVVINTRALKQAAFAKALQDIRSDIIFEGSEQMRINTKRLHHHVNQRKLDTENPDHRIILRFSFERLRTLNNEMKKHYRKLVEVSESIQDHMNTGTRQGLSKALQHFCRSLDMNGNEKLLYLGYPLKDPADHLRPLTVEWLLTRNLPKNPEEVWVDGLFTCKILDLLQKRTNQNYKSMISHKRYDLDVLFWVRDFKTLVNMCYVAYLSKQMGISTNLDPVLSFPLGPNAISISEAAQAYQTIMTGKVFPLAPKEDLSMIPIITKIEDRTGQLLWKYTPCPVTVLSDRVSAQCCEILRNVMELGTGRSAKEAVTLSGIPIPCFGKTGTANRFTNSSFVGAIPGFTKKGAQMEMQHGYTIAAYVGYDDNRPMKSERMAIYGASGALPLWIDTVRAIVDRKEYKNKVQLADIVFNPGLRLVTEKADLVEIPVSWVSGLPKGPPYPEKANSSVHVLGDVIRQGNFLKCNRKFEPVRGETE